MPDTTAQPTQSTDSSQQQTDEVTLNWLQRFTINKPRTAKVVAVTTAAVAAVGTLVVASTVSKNREHVAAAKDKIGEAAGELGEAVSPTSETA